MSFKALKCPSCGNALDDPGNKSTIVCNYCKTPVILHERIEISIANIPGVSNLFMLANNAYDGRNFAEAHSYFSQVVALDTSFVYAWMGRGSSAGWQSTLAKDRFGECITSYKQAISIGMSAAEKMAAAEDLYQIAGAYFMHAWEHMNEFKRNPLAGNLGGSAFNNIANVAEAEQWNVKLRNEMLAQYDKCNNLINLSLQIKPTLEVADAAVQVSQMCLPIASKEGKEIIGRNIERFFNIASKIDPNYKIPETKSGCFVITATMGNPFDENVLLLQEFRDTILINGPAGRIFIKYYNKIGPTLAECIAGRLVIRKACRILIVRPAVMMARTIMKIVS